MKLKNIVNKAKQETVSFFKDPKKVQGLAVGVIGMLSAGLLVNEVKTSKHKKEVKETKNYYQDFGIGIGMKLGNLETLDLLNYNNKISKEEAILYGDAFDVIVNDKIIENDVLLQKFNEVSKEEREKFENSLD